MRTIITVCLYLLCVQTNGPRAHSQHSQRQVNPHLPRNKPSFNPSVIRTWPPPVTTPQASPLPPIPTTTTCHPYEPIVYDNFVFRLEKTNLSSIHADFLESVQSCDLHLPNNNVRLVSTDAFHLLPRLRFLNLSSNHLPTNSLLTFRHVKNLEILVINDNSASEEDSILSDYFKDFESLRTLYLRRNGITEFTVPLKDVVPRLQFLDLSENQLSSPTFLEELPKNLSYLYIRDNEFTTLQGIFMARLIELDAGQNKLRTICNANCKESSVSLKGSFVLRKLDLSGNRIESVATDAFSDTRHLRHLDLSGNQLRNLENGTFHGAAWMEHLSLARNVLTTIPNLCVLKNLKSLDLSGNRISAVLDVTSCAFGRLTTLMLNDNQISNVGQRSFAPFVALENLDLSGNEITGLPAGWLPPPALLQVLQMRRNRVERLEDLNVHELRGLFALHLEDNPLPHIRPRILQNLPENLIVHLKKPVEILTKKQEEENEVDESDDIDSDGFW